MPSLEGLTHVIMDRINSRRIRTALLAALALPAACSWQGPGIAGHEGLQHRVQSYYAGRAMERGASCPGPRMNTITHAEVVEDTPERVVMDLRYRWVDDRQTVDSGESTRSVCQGSSGRRFTFARTGDGGLEVESMSGPRKR